MEDGSSPRKVKDTTGRFFWILTVVFVLLSALFLICFRVICTFERSIELRFACYDGDLESVKKLVSNGVDVNLSIHDSNHPIYGGISFLYLVLTRNLGSDYIGPSEYELNMMPPLYWAARDGHLEAVQYLLEHGAIPHNPVDGDSPIRTAARNHHKEIVELLRQYGAEYSLFEASGIGDASQVKELLDAKAIDVNTRDNTLKTPLHFAARNGYETVCELLISHGADVNAQDENSYEPIYRAIEKGHLDVTRLLIEHGVDINDKCYNYDTPLSLAIYYEQIDIIQYLIDKGADIKSPVHGDTTPLEEALLHSNYDISNMLVTANPDILNDIDLDEALLSAVYDGDIRQASWLIEHGANVNYLDKTGRFPDSTLLQEFALMSGYTPGATEMYNFLISKGADENFKSNEKDKSAKEIMAHYNKLRLRRNESSDERNDDVIIE